AGSGRRRTRAEGGAGGDCLWRRGRAVARCGAGTGRGLSHRRDAIPRLPHGTGAGRRPVPAGPLRHRALRIGRVGGSVTFSLAGPGSVSQPARARSRPLDLTVRLDLLAQGSGPPPVLPIYGGGPVHVFACLSCPHCQTTLLSDDRPTVCTRGSCPAWSVRG